MSKNIIDSIIENLKYNKKEVEKYYKDHTGPELASWLEIDYKYIRRLLDKLEIPRHTYSESNSIYLKHETAEHRLSRSLNQSNAQKKPRNDEFKQRMHDIALARDNSAWGQKTRFKPGCTPWDKGLTAQNDDRVKNNTHKAHSSAGSRSKMEDQYYEYLLTIYQPDDIVRWYDTDPRYPFECDFYIKSKDLFIECNFFYTHGPKPYDPLDIECINKLQYFKEKGYYKAIEVWTKSDVQKRKIAEENNLNYITLYSLAV